VAPHGEGDGDLMESFVALVATTMNAGTPLLLAALGIVISERSGVVNLGIEGMMLVAAVLGFSVVHWTGSYGLGFVAGALAGAALAILFGAMTLGLRRTSSPPALRWRCSAPGCPRSSASRCRA